MNPSSSWIKMMNGMANPIGKMDKFPIHDAANTAMSTSGYISATAGVMIIVSTQAQTRIETMNNATARLLRRLNCFFRIWVQYKYIR